MPQALQRAVQKTLLRHACRDVQHTVDHERREPVRIGKAGLIVTNVNPLYTGRELRLQLQDSGAKLLVSCPVANWH